MTPDEVQSYLRRVTYKPGSTITLHRHEYGNNPYFDYYLVFQTQVIDVYGRGTIPLTNTYDLTMLDQMNEEHLLNIIKQQLRSLEFHEICEWLKVDGRWVVNPHPERNK